MPSANAANAAECARAWRDQGYKVAILQDRARFSVDCDALIARDRYPGWAGSINTLFHEAVPETCPVIVAGGDDMLPDPGARAGEIAEQFLDHFGGTFGVMQPTGDDFEATRTICGSPWIGRDWMRRMYAGSGGLCDSYHQQWADDELYWVSRCAGRFLERPDLSQFHDHFLRSGRPAPAYWVESAAGHHERDCLTFIARSRSGFPGAAPADDPGLLDLGVFRREYRGRAESAYQGQHGGSSDRAEQRIRDALGDCASWGFRRVAVYGCGQHTRRAGGAFCAPPVEIAAFIDDDPARVGGSMWNYPVVTPSDAIALGIDAVILSSDAMEPRLLERSAVFAGRGVRVIPLYQTPAGVA